MRRRRITWLVFGLCALLVVDVLGWATWRVLRLERAERQATAQADQGRRERLALWQMDSLVGAIIARESARPYFVYLPQYAADQPYEEAWSIGQAGVIRPSPLAFGTGDPLIRLHYQSDAQGELISPQASPVLGVDLIEPVPRSTQALRAGRLLREIDSFRDDVPFATSFGVGAIASEDTPLYYGYAEPAPKDESTSFSGEGLDPTPHAHASGEKSTEDSSIRSGSLGQIPEPASRGEGVGGQSVLADAAESEEVSDRSERSSVGIGSKSVEIQQFAESSQPDDAQLRQQLFQVTLNTNLESSLGRPGTPIRVEVGVFKPRWIGRGESAPELVFERAVRVDNGLYTQGFWVDWPALRAELLAVAVRLIPGATLDPLRGPAAPATNALATIPVRLDFPGPAALGSGSSPTRITLIVTWIATLVALVAIGLVLRAATRLADRRGRFVTAVSHELRSPLTTFRLYADLLHAGGDDPEARRKYVEALRRESARLGTVVENVLAYAGLSARIPSGSPSRLGDILDPLFPAFSERVQAAGGTLGIDISDRVAGVSLTAAPGSLERILTNLIDNACRYGLTQDDPVVRICASLEGNAGARVISLRVSDNGAGVPPQDRSRIFSEFSRGTSPHDDRGVGLGLALARSLARAEGGDLKLTRDSSPGATFELRLPIAQWSERGGEGD